jgi:hypothetical protein
VFMAGTCLCFEMTRQNLRFDVQTELWRSVVTETHYSLRSHVTRSLTDTRHYVWQSCYVYLLAAIEEKTDVS